MKKRRTLLSFAAILTAAVAALSAVSASAATGVGGGPIAEQILGSGSDTTEVLMLHLDGLYTISEGCAKVPTPSGPPVWYDFSCQASDPAGTLTTENYQHDQVHEADFLGSSNGINQLCKQGQANIAHIDFARSSRASKATDCTGLHFVAYARDGISAESNSDGTAGSGIFAMNNPAAACAGKGFCLTQAQLQGIYGTCTITNWSQVGGQNLPIQIYTPQPGSGTRSQFETFLGITDSTVCIPAAQKASHQVPENQNSGIAPADKTTAIFPFSFAIYSTEINNGGGYALASVDGVAPSTATIADGTFPYGRFVYNVFCANPAGTCGVAASAQTVKYVGEEGWICKPSSVENPGWTADGGPHGVSPHYQVNWGTLISNKIKKLGFGALPLGLIGGGDPNSDHCRLSTT